MHTVFATFELKNSVSRINDAVIREGIRLPDIGAYVCLFDPKLALCI